MFEILVYLFENYFEANIRPDQTTLARELYAAGFEEGDIHRAFDWFTAFEAMTREADAIGMTPRTTGFRVFAETESSKIDSAALSFLLFLEQAGVMDAGERELVIDRAMALPDSEVSLNQIKWIVLMSMWNQGKVNDYLFVEDALFNDARMTLH